jgi:hypothetical protein
MSERDQVVAERSAGPAQPQGQTGELSGTPLDALLRHTYLTVSEAADYTRKPTINAFWKWAAKAAIPKCRQGRAVLYRRRDLDLAMQPQSEKRHWRRSA